MHDRSRLHHRVGGHLWTILPLARDKLTPPHCAPSRPWTTTVETEQGDMVVDGIYTRSPGARDLVIIIPGLGASPTSSYCIRAADTLRRMGYSSLRLGITIPPDRGPDMHRIGLADDINAAIRSTELQRYPRVLVIGYSLGGHGALMATTENLDARARAVAAISSPVDLAASQRHIDAPAQTLYRKFLLSALNSEYETAQSRACSHESKPNYRHIKFIREWDEVVPTARSRYASVDDFYTRGSIVNNINAIDRPTLIVASPSDPVVPSRSIRASLARRSPLLEVRWASGGHVFFPNKARIGMAAPSGLIPQLIHWFNRVAAPRAAPTHEERLRARTTEK